MKIFFNSIYTIRRLMLSKLPHLSIPLLLVVLLQGITLRADAQSKSISGIVVDETSQPLPGVTVKIKNATTAVATDIEGKYTIAASGSKTILVFSFLGYSTTEITIGTKTLINVTLQPVTKDLNEVVIQVGYGQQRRKDIAGSIGSVNVAELQKAPVRSFEEALAGRIAGVQVIAGDGQPGDASIITIRGNNSVNYSNAPLYVIDGFPIEDPNNNVINPAEIESIDVLKDASATAIYGSRGANGVIIITTKRGKVGSPVVSYNGYWGVNNITRREDLMSPYEFVRLQSEIDATRTASTYFTNGKTLESYRNAPTADFQDKIYQKAPFQNHYLSLTGGTKDTRYTVSGSYTNQEGVIIKSGFERYQGRATLDQQVNTKLKVGTNINYSTSKSYGTVPRSQNNNGGNDITFNLLYQVWSYKPVTGSFDPNEIFDDFRDPDYDPNNTLVDYRVNPLASFNNEYRAAFNSTFVANGYLEYSITKDLKYRANAGANLATTRDEFFYNSLTRQGSPLTSQGKADGPNGGLTNGIRNDYSLDNILTFNKAFNRNHQLTVTAGYSLQLNNTQSNGIRAFRVQNDVYGIKALGFAAAGDITDSYGSSSYRLQSYLGRVVYQLYGGKYTFTGSFRSDGSSKFADGKKYGYFPSVAAAWRFAEEKFVKGLNIFSSGKLRGGYGVTGNNRVPPYPTVSTLTSNGGGPGFPAYYPFGNVVGNSTQAYYVNVLGNTNLKWESTGQTDIGLEMGFFKDRILFEADYYKKTTYDLLLDAPVALSTGFTTLRNNVGKTSNEGLEFTLTTQNLHTKNFDWNSSFNISFNKNRIVELAGGTDRILSIVGGAGNTFANTNGYIAQVGKPISSMWGYVFDGIYQYADFDKQPNGSYTIKENVQVGGGGIGQTRAAIQPGDPKYKDVNGDGLINDDDLTIIGDPNPIHFGGFNNNFKYRDFDLNIFLQWSYGNQTYNANRLYLDGGTPAGYGINQYSSYANRWEPDNPSNQYFRQGTQGTPVKGLGVYSTRIVEDASFIRLKTVQLGYTLPTRLNQKIGVRSVRVYTSAQNLYTLTGYSSTDPENSVRGNGLTAGYDFSAYPRALTITLGLNVSL